MAKTPTLLELLSSAQAEEFENIFQDSLTRISQAFIENVLRKSMQAHIESKAFQDRIKKLTTDLFEGKKGDAFILKYINLVLKDEDFVDDLFDSDELTRLIAPVAIKFITDRVNASCK